MELITCFTRWRNRNPGSHSRITFDAMPGGQTAHRSIPQRKAPQTSKFVCRYRCFRWVGIGRNRFCSKLERASCCEVSHSNGAPAGHCFWVLSAIFASEFQRSQGAAGDGTTVLAFPTSISCRIFFTCRNTAPLLTSESHKFQEAKEFEHCEQSPHPAARWRTG